MHLKRNCLALLLAAVAVLGAACGSAPSGEAIAVQMAEPTTFDPQMAATRDDLTYAAHLYESLLAPVGAAADSFEPAGAESYRQSTETVGGAERTVYTFAIRQNPWSDNQAVTAQHYVNGLRRLVDPALGAPLGRQLGQYIYNGQRVLDGEVKVEDLGVEAIDDKTLKVTLEKPIDFALELFAHPALSPSREAAPSAAIPAPAEGEATPTPAPTDAAPPIPGSVTNGAYKVESYTAGAELVLAWNGNYWNRPYVRNSQITVRFLDGAAAVAALRADEIIYAQNFPAGDIAALRAEGLLAVTPELGAYGVVPNTAKAPFDDPAARRAFAAAIDRAAVAGGALGGLVQPANRLCEGVGQAALALEPAGDSALPQGDFPEVMYLCLKGGADEAIAAALASAWNEALGVQVKVEALDSAALAGRIAAGSYDLLGQSFTAPVQDAGALLAAFASGNRYGYENVEFDAALAQGHWSEAEAILLGDAAVLPVVTAGRATLRRAAFSGLRAGNTGYMMLDKAYLTIAEE